MKDIALKPPEGAAPNWTIPQDWERYTPAEHAMWDQLFERQAKMLPERVVPEFMTGLDILRERLSKGVEQHLVGLKWICPNNERPAV